MKGYLSGRVNDVRLASQPLYANVTPMIENNEIFVQIDTLPSELSAASRAAIGVFSCPTWAMAHQKEGSHNGYKQSDGKFTQNSKYRFLSGTYLTCLHQVKHFLTYIFCDCRGRTDS